MPRCSAFSRSFPQGHHPQCLWVGPEPREPNPQEDGSGLKTLTLHSVLRNIPCQLHQPFPELVPPFLFCFSQSRLVQAREGLHSNAACPCTALMPSSSLTYIFPKPNHLRSQLCQIFSLHTQYYKVLHSVLVTLHLMHSPIWIRILVGIPIVILDTPFKAWENVAEILVTVPFIMAWP